ncbi:MAG: hydantoinase/oxoprolinase family protein [Acidobacteriota bacterium]|nr:hydantoinase/oxoprolinase family protein [Acidobacteriota bacterium]MDQ2843615.1 hydantoinase/oxoprolinase family protein [Acidobacteriota bacterium]
MHIAIDTGGTFTDCVFLKDGKLNVLKLVSTPAEPGAAVLEGVQTIVGDEKPFVRHGTTVGTNAVLERKGARVAFVTTAGFEDTVAIGRQARAHLYDWFASPPPSIILPELRFGVRERTTPEGDILCSPSRADLETLTARIQASGAEAIAISLLFAFANPANELKLIEALTPLGLPISVSHVILPEFREYERASTVSVNAYLAPKVGAYLRSINSGLLRNQPSSRFDVMQSSGGIVSAAFAAAQSVRTVLSGPAGGVMGAYHLARLAGFDRIIAFDMGGTSTDVSLIDATEGGPRITSESIISAMPIGVPMLDIHTVGAGGGSIARFDRAGLLQVGPESAGSNPGPICFGRGIEPTVSDANLLLGRLQPDHFLGGVVRLDPDRTRHHMERARHPMPSVESFAEGIIELAETSMERAIRLISVERGYDPRDFALIAFGGAGPLHACALAKALRIPRVLVPKLPGALSAVGILLADAVRDYSKTVMLGADADLELHLRELETLGLAELAADATRAVASRSLDLRYAGQGYELNVPAGENAIGSFHAAHRRRYGYADETRPVEVVNVRVRMTCSADRIDFEQFELRNGSGQQALLASRPVLFQREWVETHIYNRDALEAGDRFEGPAIIVEYSATTVVLPNFRVAVDAFKNLVIEVAS